MLPAKDPPTQQSNNDCEGGFCLRTIPNPPHCLVGAEHLCLCVSGYVQGSGWDVQAASDELIHATVHALPVHPDDISNFSGPALEVTKVDAHTADIKIIHGFRAHFRKSMKKKQYEHEEFENCLIQAPGDQLKKRVLHRGSLSFSDLTDLEVAGSKALEVTRKTEWEINPTEIQLGRRIAVGGFAEVFVAEYQVTFTLRMTKERF